MGGEDEERGGGGVWAGGAQLNLQVTMHFCGRASYSIAAPLREHVAIICEGSATTAAENGELKELLHLSPRCWLAEELSQD